MKGPTGTRAKAEAEAILGWLVDVPSAASEPAATADLASWRQSVLPAVEEWSTPFAQAVCGGALSDRLGFVFAAGYRAALRALVPESADWGETSLCVTEAGGAHPRAIQTKLDVDGGGFRLTGEKRWSTLAGESDHLLVAASQGTDAEGLNRLRMVRVSRSADGVTVTAMPPTPFAPEIPHFSLTFDEVAVGAADLLPGDGYTRYIRPFRTVEDLHLVTALLGHLLRFATACAWPFRLRESGLQLLSACAQLCASQPTSRVTHLSLAGLLDGIQTLLDELEPYWEQASPPVAERWRRDQPLLEVASKVRLARTEAARRSVWSVLPGPTGSSE
jgi:hypothetical protein